MKCTAFAASAACLSIASGYVLPASWSQDAPLAPLPQGLDRAHRGKVFSPQRIAHQHDLDVVAAPADKGYGMGPFRLSSSSLSEVLQRYGIYRSAHAHSHAHTHLRPEVDGAGPSDFAILPAHPESGLAGEGLHSWDGAHSVEDWLEHVKERHARLAAMGHGGVEGMSGAHEYIVVGEGSMRTVRHGRIGHGRSRSCFFGRLRHAVGNLRPFKAGVLAFTVGAGVGALLRILLLVIVLVRRSHAHLNAAPSPSQQSRSRVDPAQRVRTRTLEDGLPAYSEIVDVDADKVDEKRVADRAGIPAAYL